MYQGNELEPQVYDSAHIQQVMAEIESNFPRYFKSFAQQPLKAVLQQSIEDYEKEREVYRNYLDMDALEEYEYDPAAFKSDTRRRCPIIQRCLWSQDEVMKAYKKSFVSVTGRQLLDSVRNISEFGRTYSADFDDDEHENAAHYGDLGLEPLNDVKYQCPGVIGYGIQSSLLYGVYARCFAHRSQNAVWALYFLSGRKDFGLQDSSEFLMVRPKDGTCEQNFFYPAELFGFYSLWIYVLLESACSDLKITFDPHYRYVYLSRLSDYVAETHREDINTYKWSSEHVESRPWF